MTHEHHDLLDGGTFDIYKEFFPPELATKLLEVIKEKTPWVQEKTKFGHKFPRLTVWYADPGLTYSYSGVTHAGLEWTPYLLRAKAKVEEVTGRKFNSVLLNYYRDGKDSIGMHADDERELDVNPVIASVSLGAERAFSIYHTKTKTCQVFPTWHGSLMVMGGTMQHHWLHGVQKTSKPVGERINLTFRLMKPQLS
jgi:alkylated DNA repair dioxygenase AlkB